MPTHPSPSDVPSTAAPAADAIIHARERVAAPAIALITSAAVGIVVNLLIIPLTLLGVNTYRDLEQHVPAIRGMSGTLDSLSIVSAVVAILLGGFVIWASLKMKRLESYTMAVAAAMVSLLPCTSPCCVLGLPFGVWAMVVLIDDRVKAGYAYAAADRTA